MRNQIFDSMINCPGLNPFFALFFVSRLSDTLVVLLKRSNLYSTECFVPHNHLVSVH